MLAAVEARSARTTPASTTSSSARGCSSGASTATPRRARCSSGRGVVGRPGLAAAAPAAELASPRRRRTSPARSRARRACWPTRSSTPGPAAMAERRLAMPLFFAGPHAARRRVARARRRRAIPLATTATRWRSASGGCSAIESGEDWPGLEADMGQTLREACASTTTRPPATPRSASATLHFLRRPLPRRHALDRGGGAALRARGHVRHADPRARARVGVDYFTGDAAAAAASLERLRARRSPAASRSRARSPTSRARRAGRPASGDRRRRATLLSTPRRWWTTCPASRPARLRGAARRGAGGPDRRSGGARAALRRAAGRTPTPRTRRARGARRRRAARRRRGVGRDRRAALRARGGRDAAGRFVARRAGRTRPGGRPPARASCTCRARASAPGDRRARRDRGELTAREASSSSSPPGAVATRRSPTSSCSRSARSRRTSTARCRSSASATATISRLGSSGQTERQGGNRWSIASWVAPACRSASSVLAR